MPRDPRLYIDDILKAVAQIREYTASMNYEVFARDRKTQDAVVWNLEIVGEAAGPLAGVHKDRYSGY
ncbi:MAG TPA: HepT-like ribonuclease domain-containing protein [Atribacteraceae bacterium]|nr:HepT-like ribonuclease domain-containing protein [Atribacteraceae bacterium]